MKDAKKPHFIKQTIKNACGTMALLHSCVNLDVGAPMENSFMEKFLQLCQEGKTPEELSEYLRDSQQLAEVHNVFAVQGQSNQDNNTSYHFVAFI